MTFNGPQVLEEVVDVDLLQGEAGGLLMEEGITTLTFYKGGFKAAAEALREQFAQVMKANPWLAGKLHNRGYRSASSGRYQPCHNARCDGRTCADVCQ